MKYQLSHPLGLHFSAPGLRTDAPVGVMASNGLLGNANGWQHQAVAWGRANTPASWSEFFYWEGVFGLGHAAHRQAMMDLFRGEAAKRAPGRQHFIGHSNSCRDFLEGMAADETLIGGHAFLFAPWAKRDCDANDINLILGRGQWQTITLGVSANDDVLGWNIFAPWYWGTTLGKDGPTHVASTRLSVWQDNSQSHCSWVDRDGALNTDTMAAVWQKIVALDAGGGA